MFKYIAFIGLVLYALKLTGFCFTDPAWRTNRQLIEAAFRIENARVAPRSPLVPDVSAYLRDFPQCCSVGNADDGMFVNALFGRQFYEVIVRYPVKDIEANDGNPFYEAILIMDCCGKSVPDRSGIGFSMPIPAGPSVKVEKVRKN